MPVVITVLNSYSGWALAAEGALLKDPTLASRIVTKCDERQQLSILREWLKAREAEHLEEGSPAAVAVLGALKKLNPLGRLFS